MGALGAVLALALLAPPPPGPLPVTVEAETNQQIEKDLNALADHGWELVGYNETAPGKVRLVLKRKVVR